MTRRVLMALTIGTMLLVLLPAWAAAASDPSPSPSVSATPNAEPTPTPPPPTPTPTAAAPTPTPTPVPTATPAPTPTPTAVAPTPTPTATPTPNPTGTPTPAATSTPNPLGTPAPPPPPPTPDPATQRLIEQTRQQLSGSLADALATVQRLSDALDQNISQQDELQQRVDASQEKLDDLDQQIQDMDDEISTTQDQIGTERAQIGVLARELYQQPDSLLLRLLRAGSLRDMVTQASDLTEAAIRADTLKGKLSSDLSKLQKDEQDRQNARQQEDQIQQQLSAALTQLEDLSSAEQDSSDQLQSLIDDAQSSLDDIDTNEIALTRRVADMLQQQEQSLIATAEQQVWQQAQLWATLNGSAIPAATSQPLGQGPASPTGTRFGWPIQGAVLTQGFGPSTLSLEPAMFGFPHFHTGLDLASANARIGAAADGVVAAVGHGTTGYGNYVIIVHGGGLVSLYGHLSVTMVTVGQTVTQGQQIGVEGTTGASTGVHLHFEVRLNGTPVDPSPYLPAVGSA